MTMKPSGPTLVSRRQLLKIGAGAAAGIVGMSRTSYVAAALPQTMIFTCHSAGSGNIIATTLSDALQKKNPTRIRVTPA